MTQASTLKSLAITGYDATPSTKVTAGAGGSNGLQQINAFLTNVSADSTSSKYLLTRLRSDCYVKQILFESAAMGGSSALDIGVWYSDNTADFPTNPALPGTAIIDNFFVDNLSTVSAVAATDVTNQSTQYTVDLRNKPLWQAVGLTSDPGGYLDIVAIPEATITTGALFGIDVRFTTV